MARLIVAWCCALAACGGAAAQELSLSGYGTIGWAQSNRDFGYQRWIGDGGTFRRDSVFGAQADLRLGAQWTATLQLKAAPSIRSDDRWDLKTAWALLAWRPEDDWLLRAGRMRTPAYLRSEDMDLGNAHDMARMPTEVYGLLPSNDFDGVSIARSWALGERDLSLDAYRGKGRSALRFWLRDGAPPAFPPGASFVGFAARLEGLVLTMRAPATTWRAGMHRVEVRLEPGGADAGFPRRYPFVELAPGLGYYQVNDALPGPGVPKSDRLRNTIYTVGIEHTLAPGWRVAAEWARITQRDTELGYDSRGGYVALLHDVGAWTPYLGAATLRTAEGTLDWFERLTVTTLPPAVPGADAINAAQRAAGEFGFATDQRSWALGTSWRLDARQRMKVEWLRTRIGRVSRFVDTPAGQDTPRHTAVQVWSASYSFSF